MLIRRRLLFLTILLLICEAVAWLADWQLGFRRALLSALDRQRIEIEPIAADDAPADGRGETLVLRAERSLPAPGEPYILGGREIPNARPVIDEIVVSPNDVVTDDRRRIFVVGGSAAYGYPYDYPQTFSAILDERLADDGYDVLNAAQVGVSSGELVQVVDRIVEFYAPDTLILMTGNNEWIHWQPAEPSPVGDATADLLRALACSRAVAAVEYLALKARFQRERTLQDRQLQQAESRFPFLPHAQLTGHAYASLHPAEPDSFDSAHWSTSKQEFLAVFEQNLEAMVRKAESKRVRVILLTVPFNFRLSPAWKHPQPLAFRTETAASVRALTSEALQLVRYGQYVEALQELDTAVALDPHPPLLHYLRATCLEALGRPLDAEAAFAQCRENMIGNLGSRLSINERIREVAIRNNAVLVDVQAIFQQHLHAADRCCNDGLVEDDCHPTPAGHRLIAEALGEHFPGQ